MKQINDYLTERLYIDSNKSYDYKYFPKTKKELSEIIYRISREHVHDKVINLNSIDTTDIMDMSCLFEDYTFQNIDISLWNVSNVKNMAYMFCGAHLESIGDISKWDVSNCKTFLYMFEDCHINKKDYPKWYKKWESSVNINYEKSKYLRFKSEMV